MMDMSEMKRQRSEAQEEGVGENQGGEGSGGRGSSCMLRNERDSSITVS